MGVIQLDDAAVSGDVVNESTITASTNVADGVDNEANMGAVVIR